MTRDDLRKQFQLILSVQCLIKDHLSRLSYCENVIYELPQLGRGEKLPDGFCAEKINFTKDKVLSACIEPQYALTHNVNLPKRYLGYIRFDGSESDFEVVQDMINQDYDLKRQLFKDLKTYEPQERKRRQLTKELFGDLLIQSLMRKISLAPWDTREISFSWCRENYSPKLIDRNHAIALVRSKFSHLDEWQLLQKEARLAGVAKIYKYTQIKTHPQYVTIQNGAYGCRVRGTVSNAHSPIIVFSRNDIQVNELKPFRETVQISKTKKYGFQPIIEGMTSLQKKVKLSEL